MRIICLFIAVFFIILRLDVAVAEEQPPITEQPQAVEREQVADANTVGLVDIINPVENSILIEKRPAIRVAIKVPYQKEGLMVLLDGSDITDALELAAEGFEYQPIQVLPSGPHTLSLRLRMQNGADIQKEFNFATRHSETFATAYSNNELTANYEAVMTKPGYMDSIPNSKVEANLRSDTVIREKDWEFTFNTNLRYLDQSLPVSSPLKKGLDASNWLLTGAYTKDNLKLKASIGDIQIEQSQYALTNFARRGGSLSVDIDDTYQLGLFTVKSRQVMGFTGGTGINSNTDDHLLGTSASVKLFEKKAEVRAFYVTGGDSGSSFGISNVSSGIQKGDLIGVVMTTDFFDNRLKTELETDFSSFDADTSDEFKAKRDSAYKLKIGGHLGKYNYEALYEHIGKDYAVIGNQGLPKDKQGISLRGGANLEVHNINLMLSRYNDNVKGNELFPRIVNYQGSLDYAFNKIPNIPMGLTYQKSMQESTMEPANSTPLNLNMDSLTGRIAYNMGQVNINFQTMYSLSNDRTSTNNDTRAVTYTLTPSFNIPNLSVNPSFSYNRSKNIMTAVTTDNYTLNLDLRSRFLHEKLSFDLGGTYNIAKVDNGSTDTRSLNTNFRLAYSLKDILKNYMNPSIGIRGTYQTTTDRINPSLNKDEITLLLVLTTSMPFSL